LIVVTPVFVTVAAARTANLAALCSETGAVAALAATAPVVPSRRVIAPASMAARASRGRVVVREFFREPNRTHWGSFIGSA
jgi:hypothetical protein